MWQINVIKNNFWLIKSRKQICPRQWKNRSNTNGNKNKIGYLPQNNFLPSHLQIKKIVDLFCKPPQTNSLKNNPHVKPFLHRKSNELSGGERRMIEILLILNSRAEYILIDEPFNGVEPLYKEEIKNNIQKHSHTKASS